MLLKKVLQNEFFRYILNGVVATSIHYSVLVVSLEVFKIGSAGISNFFASLCGISISYIGSKYFVFKDYEKSGYKKFFKFAFLYALIAAFHGAFLYVWTDVNLLNYNIGFLIAVFIQVISSYFGNKYLIFNTSKQQ